MTTYTTFSQPARATFQFSPTLDGATYNAIVNWNLFSQRYYINIYDTSGNLIVAQAMVGSPTGVNIAAATWANGTVTITTSAPHGYSIGKNVQLTITGVTPSAYNGLYNCLITGTMTFNYLLTANPGVATAYGAVNYNISLTAGYFASTLVYRIANQQFEVSP